MSTAAAITDRPHDAAILATVARHRAMLAEMAEIALELARWFKDQVMRGLCKDRDPMASFEIIGRTLRQILAMDELIAEDPLGIVKLFNKMLGRREAAERKAAEPPAPPKPPSDAPPKAPRAENLLGDLFNPLFQLREKPLAEIIAAICRDIGIDPDRYQWDVPSEPEQAEPAKPAVTPPPAQMRPQDVPQSRAAPGTGPPRPRRHPR